MTRTDITHDDLTSADLVGTWKRTTEENPQIVESYIFNSSGTLTFKRILIISSVETIITTETYTYTTTADSLILDSKLYLIGFIGETAAEEQFLHLRWPYVDIDLKTVVLLKQ